ncbi:aldo/keto reductase [Streptomyces sp. MP131-18]|uniref:aldo/keto reductase n=1 Tax=Streptomyces sp. MP131-18 TaxID=1857892 RepID=UPI00097BC6D4|nr:aldo/keto reductase [Streptomyces sp. MP131-18]ONK14207.1 L-glyceraldehyde 3-phosphate reductase [Streptomyces sp. MP131-18]
MRYRLLGRSGLRVSEAFLGTMTFGEEWGWGASLDECRKLLTAYAEAGGNVIDTANKYTDGHSERIIGDLLGSDREHFVVATKYTVSMDGRNPNAAGNHRKSLRHSLERSLTNLNTDYVDLLWVHLWDPSTPIEETMRALDDVVRAGKVLYVGISDAPGWVVSRANTLAELRGWSPFVGLQVPYSLTRRDIERDLLPMAGALDLSVAAWAPLANGVLTGKFTRGVPAAPTRVKSADISDRDVRIATEVDAVADELGVTSAQVALAWLAARGGGAVHPIIGANRLEQLTDNLAYTGLALPEPAVRRLDEASAIDLGFPLDFMESTKDFVFGEVGDRVDTRFRG